MSADRRGEHAAAGALAPGRGRSPVRVAVAAIALVWIAALHLALAWIEHRPGPRRMFGDEYTYLHWAVELTAAGEWRPDPPLWPPLYPHLLAPLIDAGGRAAVAAAQLALLLAAALAARGIGRALTGAGAAADLAAAAVLGFPPLAAYVHYLWPELLHLALLLFAVWVLVSGRRGAGWLIALGLALGLAVTAKHLLGPALPLLLAPLVFESGRRGLLRGLGRAALTAAAAGAVLAPVLAADLARHGEPTARAAARFNLWVGLDERARPEAAGWAAEDAYRRYRASAPDQRGRREFLEREIARRLGERDLPARIGSRLMPQYARLFDRDGTLTGQLPGGALHARGLGYRDPPAWIAAALRASSHALWALVLALAPLGVVLAPPRPGRRWRWLPIACVAYGLGLFGVLHVDARFRVQLLPFLLLWAAIAAAGIARRASRRLGRRRWAGASPAVETAPPRAAVAAALAASALLLVLAFGGAGGVRALHAGGSAAAASGPPVNVLLVTLDAARVEPLAPGGSGRPASPGLARLAPRGARFVHALSASPSTPAALASMFTGRYPSFHGAGSHGGGRPPAPGTVTLAGALAEAGYQTAAVVGGPALGRDFGLAQGFAVDAEPGRGQDGADVVDGAGTAAAARRLLAGMEEPWFLWLHLAGPAGELDARLDELAAAIPLDRTLLIVTAGPGQAPGGAGSGAGPDAIGLDRVRVPLVLVGPGVVPGLAVEPAVSTAAVFATVLDAAGLASPADPPRPSPVPSLLPLAARRRSSGPAVFVESEDAVGVARGDAFLVRERGSAAGVAPRGGRGPAAGAAHGPRQEAIPLAGSHVPVAVQRALTARLDAFERRAAAARAAAARERRAASSEDR